MKTKISYSLLAAAMACGLANGQTTAYTTPVGYMTTSLFGNVSGGSGGAATLVAPTLTTPTTFAAATSAAPTGSTATFASGVPTNLDGTYLLEITTGPSEGWWTTVLSSTATTIVVSDPFPASLPTGTTIAVRKFNTIASVFGATNSANLGPNDFIEILDPITQSTTVIVYASGWFDLVAEAPADNFIIYPGTAVRAIVKGTAPLSLVTSGQVKTTKTQVDLFSGEAWVGQTFSSGGTFGAFNLAPQILESDEVLLYGADAGAGQVAETFVSSAGSMFNLSTEANSDSVAIPDSSGIVVVRPVGAASTITVPAQVIAP